MFVKKKNKQNTKKQRSTYNTLIDYFFLIITLDHKHQALKHCNSLNYPQNKGHQIVYHSP